MGDGIFSASGRIGRGAWWLSQLLLIIGWVGVFGVSAMIFAASSGAAGVPGVLVLLAGGVALIWFNIASCVKRYHDRGKGWVWYFTAFIPLIGPFWQIIELGFFPGQKYGNDFGPARGDGAANAFNDAVAEIEHRNGAGNSAPKQSSGKGPVWAKGNATKGPVDATTKALAKNQQRYANVAGQPRAAFGVRGT